MLCGNCGAQLQEGDLFCTSCGTPVDRGPETTVAFDVQDVVQEAPATMPQSQPVARVTQTPPTAMAPQAAQAGQTYQGGTQPGQGPQPGQGSRRGLVVAIVVVAVVAIAAVLAFFLLSGGHGQDSSSASSASSASSSSSKQAESTSASSSSSESSASSASSTTAATSSVDEAGLLSDAQTYHDMNVFLSNFSEVGLDEMPNATSLGEHGLIAFAVAHDRLNSPQFWEDAVDAPEVKYGKTPTNRESYDRIDEVVSRYMGTTVDFDWVSVGMGYTPSSGYVYFNESDVVDSPQGVSCVTGSEKQPDGTMRVYFSVVSGDYDSSDDSLYSCTFDELLSRLGAGMASYQGVAVIKAGAYNDYTNGWVLESYTRSDQ